MHMQWLFCVTLCRPIGYIRHCQVLLKWSHDQYVHNYLLVLSRGFIKNLLQLHWYVQAIGLYAMLSSLINVRQSYC